MFDPITAIPITVQPSEGDPRNILGVITHNNEYDLYTIATRHGILSNKYTRADFTLCRQQLLKDTDINRDKHVLLREALKSCTASGGQGFVKCNCAALQKKCGNLICECFKAQLKCNSRCHNSLSCSNKYA